jgi:carbonic anhydrase/acetyltransferase-like protein (isoleucine patch superfamily)
MNCIAYNGQLPQVHKSVFVGAGVQLIGNVKIGKDSSVWFNSVLRGDINAVEIGERTNIQDAAVLHVTSESMCRIGSDVTVGHRAIIHACTVGDCCLIGMGAIVLDNATIGENSLVAAGAVVLQNATIPEGVLVAGVPAKVIRRLTDEERTAIRESAEHYVAYARGFQE